MLNAKYDINSSTRRCLEKRFFHASLHFPNQTHLIWKYPLHLRRKPVVADPNSKPTYFLVRLGRQLRPHWNLYSTSTLLSLSSELHYFFDDFSLPGSFRHVGGPPTQRGSAPCLVEVLAVRVLSIDLLEVNSSSSFCWNSPKSHIDLFLFFHLLFFHSKRAPRAPPASSCPPPMQSLHSASLRPYINHRGGIIISLVTPFHVLPLWFEGSATLPYLEYPLSPAPSSWSLWPPPTNWNPLPLSLTGWRPGFPQDSHSPSHLDLSGFLSSSSNLTPLWRWGGKIHV